MDPTTAPQPSTDAAGNDVRQARAPGEIEGPAETRRATLIRSGLVVGILVLVFGVILPQVISYEDVIAALKSVTLPQFLLLLVLIVGAWLVNGLVFSVLVPTLRVARGTASYITLAGIGASVPLGPWNLGVVWVLLRGWGVGNRAATSGIALYGIVDQLATLALPAIALVALGVAGLRGAEESGFAMFIATLSTVILIIASVGLAAIVRSDRAAGWISRRAQAVVSWTFKWLGRQAPDVASAVRTFRDQLGDVLRRRGLAALTVSILSHLALCGVFVAALRIVGVPDQTVSASEVLAVYALTAVITIIPLSPGGAGVPELLYIGGLTAIAGTSNESLVTAGVMLFRVLQWFLPIPIAWVFLKIVRRGKPMLPTGSELRAYAREGAGSSAPMTVAGQDPG